MATVVEFCNWGSFAQDLKEPIFEVTEASPSPRRGSIVEEVNAVHRGNSIGAEERVPSYHKDDKAKYCLPNDFQEHVRLETQAAHISEMMRNKVLHAPVKHTAERLLDIGCGTGIVTDLMSEAYPQSECIGLDLSRVPQIRPHHTNVQFFQGNVTGQKPTRWASNDPGAEKMPQDQELFDYMFSRLLILGMSDWSSFLKTEFSLLKPGGWAEVHDLSWDWYGPDGSIVSDKWKWLQCLEDDFQSKKKRMDVRCGMKAEGWMKDAGFEDLQVFRYLFPFCGATEATLEARQFGKFNAETVPTMLHHAIEKAVADGQPLTPELREKIDELRAEMKATLVPGRGMYQIFYVTIGRKPQ